MASTSDDSNDAKKPASKPATRKPVTSRPAAKTPPSLKPGAAAANAKPVGKQAQAEARVAEEAAKNGRGEAPRARPIAPSASPAATVAPAGADTPRAVHVTHTPETAPKPVATATAQPAQPVFAQPIKKRPGPIALVVVGLLLATFAILLIIAYFMLALGPTPDVHRWRCWPSSRWPSCCSASAGSTAGNPNRAAA